MAKESMLSQVTIFIPADIDAPGALQEFILGLRQMAMNLPPFTKERANMLHLAVLAEKDDTVARQIWENTYKKVSKDPETKRISMPKATQ